MGVTTTRSGLTGTLTTGGRLTRAGVWLLVGLGGFFVLAAVSQWRALAVVTLGLRAPGTVTEQNDVTGSQQDYQVRVAFAAAGVPAVAVRQLAEPLGRGRSPRLRVGDPVGVAYRADRATEAVLLHAHEQWAAAPWMFPVGLAFWALAWFWRPRAAGEAPAISRGQ